MGASAVRQNGFSAVRTSAPLRLGQAIVGTALVLDSSRSPSLGYRHRFVPIFLPLLAHSVFKIEEADYRPTLSVRKIAIRGSLTALEQLQDSLFRFTPQLAHSPWQLSEQSGLVGNAKITCSAISGARSISSIE